jgi:TonB family protein
MASILVVEQEQRSAERINQALGGEGWRVRVVPGRVQALQAAASEAPDLVLLSSDIPGAEELASSFRRSAGGPGVVVILPERAEVGSGSLPADDRLARPFTEQDLRIVVRRAMAVRRSGAGPAGAAGPSQVRLTSQDIFGDVLAEVEGQVLPGADRLGAAQPPAAGATAPPTPPTPRPVPPRTGRDAGDEELARRLEKTLSGVLAGEPRPRPAPAPARKEAPGGNAEIDALLSKTLGKLEPPSRPRAASPPPPSPLQAPGAAPATPPAPPTPPNIATPAAAASGQAPPGNQPAAAARPTSPASIAPPPAVPPPPAQAAAAAAPLQAARPAPAQAAPQAAPSTGAPAAGSSAPAPPAAESTAVRRAQRPTGEVDLSELEDLARPRRRTGEASRSGVTAPAGTAPAGAPPPPPPTSRPILQAVPPLPAAPAPKPAAVAPPPGSRSGVAAADAAATQRIPIVPREEAGNKPGERFGQYTLLEKIAVGGMAEVWKARMRGVEGFQKTVAIKKILPYMTDSSEFVTMFIDEAKLAAQLNHPNIVHIYDLGKIGRDYYIAMEYVEGKDLRSLLNGARRLGLHLPFGLALLIGARLAGALEYAHHKRDFEGRGMGLVHRDVSPQNVLLSLDGDVKLCDFGIAKAVSKAGQTQMGALKGKLQYMSPEQAWGKPVDHRSDIFSLGAVLFELLTGERLFSGDTEMSVLEAVRQSRVRSPRQLDPTIPLEVDEVVVRALASQPEDRFQSAGELEQRLEAVLYALKPSPSHSDLAAFVRQVSAGDAGEHLAEAPAAAAPPARGAIPAPPAEPHPASPATAPHPAPAAAAAPGSEVAPLAPVGEVRVEEGGRQSRRILVAAIAALVVLAVVTFFVLNRRKAASGEPPRPAVAAPVRAPGAPAPAGAAAPTPAGAPGAAATSAAAGAGGRGGPQPGAPPSGIAGPLGTAAGKAPSKADVEGMVGQEVAKQAEAMKKKLEDQKKQLEKQIAQAEAGKTAAKPQQAAAGAAGTQPGSSAEAGRTPAGAAASGAAATAQPGAQPPAAEPAARPASPAAAPPPPEGEPQAEPARGQTAARRSEAPAVKLGELVSAGPGVVSPALVSVPKPEYPPVARKLRIQGVVVVSILVDENGHVEDVKVSESAAQNVGLNESATAAARTAQYKPATKDGVRVKMWTRLKIPFKL